MNDAKVEVKIQSIKLKYYKPELIKMGTIKTETLGNGSGGGDKHCWSCKSSGMMGMMM